MKFYDELMAVYENVFPLAPMKVAWLKSIVALNQPKTLLDVGCATGALCGEMAQLIPRVDGFDLDRQMIIKASQDNSRDNVTYCVGNMLSMEDLYPGVTYDLITCFGNTLVHLDHFGLKKTLEGIHRRLDDKGLFIGQIINYDYIFDGSIKTLPLIDNEKVRFERRYDWLDEAQLEFKTLLEVKDQATSYENTINLYPIRRRALESLLVEVGFKAIIFYKNYQGTLAEGEHLPLIFIAKG